MLSHLNRRSTALFLTVMVVGACLTLPPVPAGAVPEAPAIQADRDSGSGSGKGNGKPVLSNHLAELRRQDQSASRRSVEHGPVATSAGLVERRADGVPLVHVRTDPQYVDAVVASLRSLDGVDVVHQNASFVTAHVPVDQLDAAASIANVRSVFPSLAPQTRCGSKVSEGDQLMGADDARTVAGVDGTGVTVGVISDSFDQDADALTSKAQDVATGDLPGTNSPCGSKNNVVVDTPMGAGGTTGEATDEGRAMAQIIHDLAPGADMRFGSASNGLFQFADEVRNLAANGADVIVDDIGYFAEPFFQQGPVGDAIADVVDDGVSYLSALGNDRVTDTSGNDQTAYETPAFRPILCNGLALPPVYVDQGARCHDMDGTAGADPAWTFTIPANQRFTLNFQWDEPWVGVENDFDVLLFGQGGTYLGGSFEDNIDDGVPVEILDIVPTAATRTIQIAIVRFPETPDQPVQGPAPRMRWMQLQSAACPSPDLATESCVPWSFSEYTTGTGPDTIGGGYAYGHPAVPDAIGVGAVPYFSPTNPEPFSSRGPVTHYWGPTGDFSAPAPRLASPRVIQKPDVAGIDGGENTFFGGVFEGERRFFGTSAAAPHVAAVVALMREANPLLTPAQITAILEDTANPLANGDATQWGAGLVQADAAVAAALDLGDTRTKFVPVDPARLLDTRNGTGYDGPKPVKGQTVEFQVTGEGGIPASEDVKAVVLTLTATSSTRAGFITAHPSEIPRPLSANLNLERSGQTISNQSVVAVPPSGRASVYTDQGSHLIADVVGYYTAVETPVSDGRLVPLTPSRLLDTRIGVGYSGPKPASGASVELQVGGEGNVPDDATAVILNVTATGTRGSGFVTAHPSDIARPEAAALTVERSGQTIGTHVTVGLSSTGEVDLYTSRTAHLIADVVGYYTAETDPASEAGLFVPLAPTRLLDTRTGNGYTGAKPTAGQNLVLLLAGRSAIPEDDVAGVSINLTVTQTTGAGFVTLYPSGVAQPTTSSLNTDAAGQTRPNLVTSGTSATGRVRIFTSRSAHLVGDVAGYYVAA